MMAMTTSSSISVNADREGERGMTDLRPTAARAAGKG
jgi:hypothetical protein